MPFGTFLDTLPAGLFMTIHVALILFGIWVAVKAAQIGLPYAKAFWLYPIVHVGFLAYLTGIFTIRMSVFLEQVLIFAMLLWIILKAKETKQL